MIFARDLRKLVISFTNVTEHLSKVDVDCHNLEVLEAEECYLTDDFASAIPNIPKLKKLSLAKNLLTHRFIDDIISLK
jgi:hypothetical protein